MTTERKHLVAVAPEGSYLKCNICGALIWEARIDPNGGYICYKHFREVKVEEVSPR